jgi:4-carboxymuconolactone decarboxylase
MVRIAQVQREDVAPEYQALYVEMRNATTGLVGGPYRALMHVPDVALPWRRWIEDSLRGGLNMPLSLMELAILVTAREERCEYVWGAHQRAAERAGSRWEAVQVIRGEAPAAGLTADEATVIAFAEQVLRNRKVDDAVFDTLKARWGENDVIRLSCIIGCYRLIATLLAAFEITPDSEGQANTFPKV